MKNTISKILFTLFSVALCYSQCPPANAIKYKNEAAKMGTQEFSKQQAYIFLATYYNYKCQCENGVDQPVRMAETINSLVDTYSAYTKNAYGKINKVLTCKSKDGGTSIESNESGDPNASNHGSGKYFDIESKELEELSRKVLGDSSIVTQQLKAYNAGKDLGVSIKNNENVSENLENVSQIVFGENSEITKSISNFNLGKSYSESVKNNDLAGMFSYGIQLQSLMDDGYALDKEESNKLKNDFFEYLRKSKKNGSALIVQNENELNNPIDLSNSTRIQTNQNIDVKEISNIELEIVSNKKIGRKKMISDDNTFFEIQSPNLSVNKDFKIEFKLGLKKYKIFLEENLAIGCLKVYISNGNVLEFSPYFTAGKYSFSPWLNDKYNGQGDGDYIYENRMEWIEQISDELNIQELRKMIFSGIRDMGKNQNLSRKEYKKLRKDNVEEIENSKNIDDWFFDKITITKEKDIIKVKREYFDILTKNETSAEITIPYTFLFENKISFGLSSIGPFALPKEFELKIKDIKIYK